MKQLLSRTYNIHYSDVGQGKTLVFLHGFCEDLRMWEELTAAFEEYRIVCIDLPGFGKSDPVAGLSIRGMAEKVKEVLDHLNIDRCLLFGHSMGGYVSLAFAERYPECLEGMALIHSHPYADTAGAKVERNRSIDFIRRNGHLQYVRQLVLRLFPPAFAEAHPDLLNTLSERASGYSSEGIIGGLYAMRDRLDRSEVLEQLTIPVLLIIGRDDVIVSPDFSLAQTALPSIGSIHLLDNIGHMLMFENPNLAQRLIQDFIDFCTAVLGHSSANKVDN